MRISPIKLRNQSNFIVNYRQESDASLKYFDYSPFNDDKRRLSYINERSFNRAHLVDMLTHMNKEWDAPTETFKQIDRLQDDKSVLVIGGQQAGLGTGPMYTVNKIISIIKLAREKEAQLKIPVIPLFWIAGEDHDYDEINHLYIEDGDRLKKLTTRQQQFIKKSISHIDLDHAQTEQWLTHLFLSLQETEHTKKLYKTIGSILEKSQSFVDFFAGLIFYLFENEGLVLFDSAHDRAREEERSFFISLVEKQRPFAKAVSSQLEKLRNEGYDISIDAEIRDTHIFYHDERNERILLQREGNLWVGKNDELSLTTEDILQIAEEKPNKLSNNVVSRPIMQEYLFPTLYFVAGDGEITYWAALKEAFHLFDFQVPPVIPRLSFTFINEKIDTLMQERGISVAEAINEGVSTRKLNYLQAQQSPPIPVIINEVKEEIEKIHQPLRHTAKAVSEDMHQLARQNLDIVYREMDYLKQKMETEIVRQHKVAINKYNTIENVLHPNKVLQERVWHPIPFLNDHGIQFIADLIKAKCSFEEDHHVIYL